jgi:hypothetical protein
MSAADIELLAPAAVSGRARFWLRLLRQRGAVIGGVIVLAVVFTALFAPWLAPHPYDATDLLNAWAPPDATNLLGTDKLGRDILSRIIFGTRIELTISLHPIIRSLRVIRSRIRIPSHRRYSVRLWGEPRPRREPRWRAIRIRGSDISTSSAPRSLMRSASA